MRKALAARIAKRGFRIVSGGTDNHLMLVDVFSKGINGKQAEAGPRQGWNHGQQEHDPFRRESAIDAKRHSHWNAGADHTRNEGSRNGSHRGLDRGCAGPYRRRERPEESAARSGRVV